MGSPDDEYRDGGFADGAVDANAVIPGWQDHRHLCTAAHRLGPPQRYLVIAAS